MNGEPKVEASFLDTHHVLFPAFLAMLMRAGGTFTVTQKELTTMRLAEIQMLENDKDVTFKIVPPKGEVWVGFHK